MPVTANLWRQDTPGVAGWARTARPQDPNKYLMVSTDTHLSEPGDLWAKRLSPDLAERLPRIEVDEQGQKWQVTPGMRRVKVMFHEGEGDDEDKERTRGARSASQIVADMDRDGVDLQIGFPNRGLTMFGSPTDDLLYGMAAAYNDWLVESFASIKERMVPMAALPTANLEMTLVELKRIAKMDFFRGIVMPSKPIYGPANASHSNYNLRMFDPLWASLQDLDLTVTVHISTGMDPRMSRGNGGAIINYAAHAMTSAVEPVANLCASGVFDRFPKLRFATIEAGVGWVPWMLEAMDEAYKKHYMWVRPNLSRLPSEYYLEHCFSTFQEDPYGLLLVGESRFENCFMWANDYPHHEGSWPHSAAAIERQMSGLTEAKRTKILGDNAVRCFKIQDLVAARKVSAVQ